MAGRFVRQNSVDLDDVEYEPVVYATTDAPSGDAFASRGRVFGTAARLTRWERIVNAVKNPRGLKIVPVVSLLVSVSGALVTRLGEDYTAVQLLVAAAIVRFCLTAAHVAFFRHRPLNVRGDRSLLLAVATFAVASMVCNYYAITHLTLADATVLRFLFPMFTAWLSTLVLREPCVPWEALGVLVGLVGVVFIAQPPALFSGGGDDTGRVAAAAIGVLGAAAAAASLLCVRMVGYSGVEPAVVVFWLSAMAALVTPFLMLVEARTDEDVGDWELERVTDLAWFAALGFLAYAADMLFTQAVQTERTGPVTMLRYLDVVFAFVLELFVLHQGETSLEVIGCIAVLGSAAGTVYYRWRRKAAQRRNATATGTHGGVTRPTGTRPSLTGASARGASGSARGRPRRGSSP